MATKAPKAPKKKAPKKAAVQNPEFKLSDEQEAQLRLSIVAMRKRTSNGLQRSNNERKMRAAFVAENKAKTTN